MQKGRADAGLNVQSALKRDQGIILLCVFTIAALAWLYLVFTPNGMNDAMAGPRTTAWT